MRRCQAGPSCIVQRSFFAKALDPGYLAFIPERGIITRYDRACSQNPAHSALRPVSSCCLGGAPAGGQNYTALSLSNEVDNSAVYLDLELPSDRAKLEDPELYLSDYEDRLVILDEIHRLPGVFQSLRGLIDRRKRKGKRAGQFLLLGSASIDLLQQSAETLAGRIANIELTPFLESEIVGFSPNASQTLWVRGGFRDSFLAETEAHSYEWRAAFIQTYLERDVPSLGPRIPAETLHRFWQMLAHNQGQMMNAAQLAAGLGISGQTVARYLDIMVDLLLVRRLQPWASNVGKRLVRSPKVYVRDSGLLHTLLGIRDQETLLGHPVVGSSWEGMVIENILSTVLPNTQAWFYRTSVGAEVDLVLETREMSGGQSRSSVPLAIQAY